jgi:hypothetical protein
MSGGYGGASQGQIILTDDVSLGIFIVSARALSRCLGLVLIFEPPRPAGTSETLGKWSGWSAILGVLEADRFACAWQAVGATSS